MVKKSYKVGAKNSIRKLISKSLDRKIKAKLKELKSNSNNPKGVTYLYASKVLEVKK